MIIRKINFKIIFFVLFIPVFVYFVWHKVLNQALLGEGPTYLVEPYASMLGKERLVDLLKRYDVQAILFFRLVREVIKDRVEFYMAFLLLGETLVGGTLFLLVQKLTKSYLAAFFTLILFVANYVGSFEMLGLGYYQWFIQRVPNFSLSLLVLVLFNKFLETNKKRYYLFSLFLYALNFLLAHYTFLFLPFIVIYSLVKSKNFLRICFYLTPFVLWSVFLLRFEQPAIKFDIDYWNFLLGWRVVWQGLLKSLLILTIPPEAINWLFSRAIKPIFLGVIDRQLFSDYLSSLVLAIYILIFLFIHKKSRELRPLGLSLLLLIPISIVMALFLRPTFPNEMTISRYLYFPSMLVSIFWGTSLALIFRYNLIGKIMVILLVFFWASYNTSLIWKNFAEYQMRHTIVRRTIVSLREKADSLESGAVVALPAEVGWYGSEMLEKIYTNKNLLFIPNDIDLRTNLLKSQYQGRRLIFLTPKN